MSRAPLTEQGRHTLIVMLQQVELAQQALGLACAYTSVLELVDLNLPGLQELHKSSYVPQSYGLSTTNGAIRAMLLEGEFDPDLAILVTGCLDYVLDQYNLAGQNFRLIEQAAPYHPEAARIQELLAAAGQDAELIQSGTQATLDLLRGWVGDEQYFWLYQEGKALQERIAAARRGMGGGGGGGGGY